MSCYLYLLQTSGTQLTVYPPRLPIFGKPCFQYNYRQKGLHNSTD